ncbi:MAG: maltose alpha-D-glucosyltransferase [Candidatus Dormibacteria bacterium]
MNLASDRLWYRDAVIYEVFVRGFYDANGDGVGDLPGLISQLDYLHWLGINCLWLLPIFTSPQRDGGYDISDFYTVQPEYGSVEDVRRLVEEAHSRGIRVITDLVMNHTSDQHPWFQEARSSRNAKLRDWYVWSDTQTRYSEARVIFFDSEASNWALDPQTGAYYWHRFFSHQPDLNYENPEVQEEMLRVVKFWLGLGLDGLRLDAVPYLFEAEGSNCESLPATHDFLKRVRREVDQTFPDRVLLAEANQWPTQVRDYFGDGDECQMCFHFPLMPRMFMALRQEQRYPITEVLAQTPAVPADCQWGIFLRNHDELTLEMVSDAERDYMYAEYASDPRMKLNFGIRRRLAPLLSNGRRQMELLHGLLLSFPGTPILYYGDEIGMGDNVYVGDRDGVRTPMQWSADRNGGFSKADFAQLYLPPLMDPLYGYQACNVEQQQRSESSFLQWLRRFIQLRQAHPVFGRGTFQVVEADNPSILAFLRSSESETMLCVNNLSRFAQPVALAMRQFQGVVPVELLGRVPFPKIGSRPYPLTLGPHGFYWLRLEAGR